MHFEIVGAILDQETIAIGRAIRELARLRRAYGVLDGANERASLRSGCKMGRSGPPKSTGTKRTASGARSSRSSASSRERRHVVCLENAGYVAFLEPRKIYVALSDREAARNGLLRVIDESGEDYLYPKGLFADIRLSPRLASALASGS